MDNRQANTHFRFTLRSNEPRCTTMMSEGDHKVLKYWANKTHKSMLETLHALFTQGLKCIAEDHASQLGFYTGKYNLRP